MNTPVGIGLRAVAMSSAQCRSASTTYGGTGSTSSETAGAGGFGGGGAGGGGEVGFDRMRRGRFFGIMAAPGFGPVPGFFAGERPGPCLFRRERPAGYLRRRGL